MALGEAAEERLASALPLATSDRDDLGEALAPALGVLAALLLLLALGVASVLGEVEAV